MYRFFVQPEQLLASPVRISGEDYKHIHNVLRLKVKEHVYLCAEDDKEYECEIIDYDDEQKEVLLVIVDVFSNCRELSSEIVLFQGFPKGDKLELIIQKAVELGVSEIVPVMMKRCVVKLDEKKAEKKVERYNSIALSAAKQSKRGIIPRVSSVMDLKTACEYCKSFDTILVPYELANGMELSKSRIKEAAKTSKIAVFIGPEGGFDEKEIEQLEAIGGKRVSLGHRILRTETAGLVVLSLLMFQLESD